MVKLSKKAIEHAEGLSDSDLRIFRETFGARSEMRRIVDLLLRARTARLAGRIEIAIECERLIDQTYGRSR